MFENERNKLCAEGTLLKGVLQGTMRQRVIFNFERNSVMGLDQKGDIVFRVVRGANSKWDVNEEGFDKPLASFDSEQDARSYANDIAKTKQGSAVVVE